MISLVKIYMKRHDRHNKTLCTTDFFNSVFCLVSCSFIYQVPYFILNKVVTDKNLKRLLLGGEPKKQTNKQTKTLKKKRKKKHLGQVFQSVTSFKTQIFFFSLMHETCVLLWYIIFRIFCFFS